MKSTLTLAVVMALATAGILAADLLVLDKAAIGVLYVGVVLLTWFFPKDAHVIAAALACSLLACAAMLVSFPQEDWAPSLANVGISLLAIWTTAVLVVLVRSREHVASRKQQDLQRRLDQGAATLEESHADLQLALESEAARANNLQRALRDADTLYSSLVEALPVNVIRKDLNGRFTMVNQSVCRLLDKPKEAILGKTDFDLFPRELAEKYRRDDQNVIRSGRTFEDVEEHQRSDGGKMYVEVMKGPVYDSKRNIIGVQIIFRDVTARKKAEAELMASEARKTAIFEAAMDCIVVCDQQGRIVEFNRAAEKTFGYRREEVIGRDMAEVLIPSTSRQRHRDNLSRYAGAGEDPRL